MNTISSPITRKVNNVFIHVKDLKKSAKWYCDLMGIDLNMEQVSSPVHNIPVTSETGLTLDDHTFDPSFQFQPANHVLFNFYAQNIEEAYSFVKAKGIVIVRELEWHGDFAYFNFQDPDGNVLMICNN